MMTHMDELRQAWAAADLRQDLEDIALYRRVLPAVMAGSMDNARMLIEIIEYVRTQIEERQSA